MGSIVGEPKWLRGIVKSVPSGDTLVIMENTNIGAREKKITLSSLLAPRLAQRDGSNQDEPFAWDSREYLRKLCIGKVVKFCIEYTIPSGREFGSVFFGDNNNISWMVISHGWAKVRDPGQKKEEACQFLATLLRAEDQAKKQGLGVWNKIVGEDSIRFLPGEFDAQYILDTYKCSPIEAIVEHVFDGSTLRVQFLPEFINARVLVAGIQSPSMRRKASESLAGVPPEAFGPIAKHFTEMRILNRDVRVIPEGRDKYDNLIASIYYSKDESAMDLAMELVENGLAKYVGWSAAMMERDARERLKSMETEAKKAQLSMWKGYVPESSNSKAIQDQNFTGKVIEVVSGDCIVVVDEPVPLGDRLAEKRVYLSSIKAPKMGNPRVEDKPAEEYAWEARDLLRKCLIGRKVKVSMEYTRKVSTGNNNRPDLRVMDFGSIFLEADASATTRTRTNVAELLVARGYAKVIKHRDSEERSHFYEDLLAAENRAISGQKGMYGPKKCAVRHISDRSMAVEKDAVTFLPFLQKGKKSAIVEHVFSGHRLKLFLPEDSSFIAFSLSGVRCPGRNEPFSDEAIAFVRRKIMNHEVEIQVDTVDKNGTFLGSLWYSNNNIAGVLLGAGLARLQSFRLDKISDGESLKEAEQYAKTKKLRIWQNFIEGAEVSNGSHARSKQKEEMEVIVTGVLDDFTFYVHILGDDKIASIGHQLASLSLEDARVPDTFDLKKDDIVIAQFSVDNTWNRAKVLSTPDGEEDAFTIFYIDYGNVEKVSKNQLRPFDHLVSSGPGLAQLCRLAYINFPNTNDEWREDALKCLREYTIDGPNANASFKAIIEEKNASEEKPILAVTLIDTRDVCDINAAMVQSGCARVEKWGRRDSKEKREIIDRLRSYEAEARLKRKGIWSNCDYDSDEESKGPAPVQKGAGRGKR